MKTEKKRISENRKFFDRATRFYEFGLVKIINRMIQKRVLRSVDVKPKSRVLDAGCGTGLFLEILKKKGRNVKLYGIDISKKMVSASKKRLGKEAEISLKPVENLSFRNHFDYIFSVDSFHHYANQEKAMESFRKALKKGGKLVVADFSFGSLGNRIFSSLEPGNSRMHLKKEFKELFKKHGFQRIHQKRLGLFSILTVGEK